MSWWQEFVFWRAGVRRCDGAASHLVLQTDLRDPDAQRAQLGAALLFAVHRTTGEWASADAIGAALETLWGDVAGGGD